MDREEYDRKIKTLLNDGTYAKMKKKKKELRDRFTRHSISARRMNWIQNLYRRLNPSYSHAPCLPTVQTYPYDPLSASAPLDQPRMILVVIISPLAGQTASFVKNSAHFTELLRQRQLKEEEVMVSVDVSSLLF